MARTVDAILKSQLGSLLAELAVMTAALEERDEKIVELQKLVPVAPVVEKIEEK